ncbi:hypothetical protein BS17DRAFT_769563 [Gyrodon lividus]|nr:hypothetical protein BS17DRAFT_769563 [Gyrodon lividus]
MSSNPPFNQLSPAEQAEFCCRFPCAGWWVGALPPPPDLAPYYHPPNGLFAAEPNLLMGPTVPLQAPPYQHTIGRKLLMLSLLLVPRPAQMDVVPAEAELGYKFSTNCVGEDSCTLSNAQDLVIAIDLGQSLVCCARTCKIEVMIHNLSAASTKKHCDSAGGIS